MIVIKTKMNRIRLSFFLRATFRACPVCVYFIKMRNMRISFVGTEVLCYILFTMLQATDVFFEFLMRYANVVASFFASDFHAYHYFLFFSPSIFTGIDSTWRLMESSSNDFTLALILCTIRKQKGFLCF